MNRLETELVNLVAKGHRHGALGIHPYFGRMDPALAATLISTLSAPGDIVLDPFCGSGTVLHEALLLGRHVIGWDSSPLATLISAGKLAGLSAAADRDTQTIEHVVAPFMPMLGEMATPVPDAPIPSMPRIRSIHMWFGEHALRELAFIKEMIQEQGPHLTLPGLLLTRIAFSRVIVKASRQKGESHYTSIDKPDFPGRVIELFLSALREVRTSAHSLSALMGNSAADLLEGNPWKGSPFLIRWMDEIECAITCTDARVEEPIHGRAQLVVTSPPYLMSWDYGLYHKFRFYWLHLDLDGYEDTEIGRHLRRRRDDEERYSSDMKRSFTRMAAATSSGAHVAMVNAPSAVYGRSVDTNSILIDCAEACGFALEWQGSSLAIPGPHHGMYASLTARRASAPGTSGKHEHVLIFRRS